MKSYIKIFSLAFATVLTISGCSTDKLDITQRGSITTNEYIIADDDECLEFIAGVYSHVRGNTLQYYMSGYDCYATYIYKLGQMGQEYGKEFEYTDTSESTTYSQMYSYLYQTIYWCNMIIEYLPDNNVASSSVVSRVVAEARAVRAATMLDIVMLWGNPILADHILTGEEGNTDHDESLDWIEQELSECAEDLPSKSSKDGQSSIGGRFTKEAAYAYLGRAYLYDGEYTLAAQTLYNKVISTGLYELIDDFSLLNSSESDFCSEFLWEFDFTEASGYSSSQEGGWDVLYFHYSGSISIPDGFYASSGWGNANGASAKFGEFMEEHDKVDGVPCSRYLASMVNYEEFLDSQYFTYDTRTSMGMKSTIDNNQGYFRVKFIPLADDIVGTSSYTAYSVRNIAYMRYAEVLLNYAEAVAQGGTAQSLSGLEALNMVRRRAGLEDAPSLSMDNETYGVKAERWAELFHEGHRFIDLVRWGDASDELADCGLYKWYFSGYLDGDNSAPQSKDQWDLEKTRLTGNGFVEGKHEYLPYPYDELVNDPNLVQNPNW